MSAEQFNFDKLPCEMKVMIVQRCTKETRNALRACSDLTREVVDKIKIGHLDGLILEQDSDVEFCIRSRVSPLQSDWTTLKFDNFKEFQNEVSRMMKAELCIKSLTVRNIKENIQLSHWYSGYQKRVLVEEVSMDFDDEERDKYGAILSQLEPGHLSRVYLARGKDSAMFDLPQLILAKELTIKGPIREDQLMKYEAESIVIESELEYPLRSFVEKCLSREKSQMKRFLLNGELTHNELKAIYAPDSESGVVVLPTSDPRQKLELYFEEPRLYFTVSGLIRYESEKIAAEVLFPNQPVLRTIESVEIAFSPRTKIWTISVLRSFHRYYDLRFRSMEKFQEKLDEVLESTDCIAKLTIKLPASDRDRFRYDKNLEHKIHWAPRTDKLVVKRLWIEGNHSITSVRDLLDQIDPKHIDYLEILSDERDETLLDLPHVYNCAEGFSISGSVLRPDQLAKLNPGRMNSGDEDDKHQNLLLTSADINQHIKKFLLSCNGKNFHGFSLLNVAPTITEEEVLEGLDVLSTREVRRGKILMIDTPYRDYTLELEYMTSGFKSGISGNQRQRD